MKPALLYCGLLLAAPVAMAESMRCGSRIIGPGTSSAELLALCGDPTQVSNGTIYAGATGVARGSPGVAEESSIETWTYNFGPNLFMERVRIENGVIVRIDSLGYGYNEP